MLHKKKKSSLVFSDIWTPTVFVISSAISIIENIITCICIVQLQSQIPKFPIQNNDIWVQYLQKVIRKEKPPLPMQSEQRPSYKQCFCT